MPTQTLSLVLINSGSEIGSISSPEHQGLVGQSLIQNRKQLEGNGWRAMRADPDHQLFLPTDVQGERIMIFTRS